MRPTGLLWSPCAGARRLGRGVPATGLHGRPFLGQLGAVGRGAWRLRRVRGKAAVCWAKRARCGTLPHDRVAMTASA